MTFHQRRQEGRLRETPGPRAAAASGAPVRTRGSRLFKELFHLTAERKRSLKSAFFFFFNSISVEAEELQREVAGEEGGEI